jgi:hypothetical protein
MRLSRDLYEYIKYLEEQAKRAEIESDKAGTFAERDYYSGMCNAYKDAYDEILYAVGYDNFEEYEKQHSRHQGPTS